MKKKLILPVIAVIVGGVAVFGTSSALAQSPTPAGKPMSLVQRIAQRFNLNQADVQAVFDQHHQEMMAYRKDRIEDQLNQAVKDGKITENQKQKILAKLSDIQTSKQNWKNMTPDERRTAMQDLRADLQNWAKQNGIDPSWLLFMHPGHARMMRGWWGM